MRWLLVVGAMAVIRYARKYGAKRPPWLARLMEPNKAWAIMVRNERYKDPKLLLAA